MEQDIGRIFMLRCPEDEELVSYITKFAEKQGIKGGIVNVIGALRNATIGYFDPIEGHYIKINIPYHTELLSGMGNISIKEERPFLHLHVVLGDREGNVKGGHLFSGTVYVGEIFIMEIKNAPQRRKYGNLHLWPPTPL